VLATPKLGEGGSPSKIIRLQPARLPLQKKYCCRRHAAFTFGRMIKDRPHRLGLIYISQPLYFVTFATRDRKSIPSLECAQLALQQHAHCAIAKFDVALGRYVIMPDHVHLFVRGGRNFTLATWIGGLKRAISVALTSTRLWQPGFFDHILATKATARNGITSGTIQFGLALWKSRTTGHTKEKSL